MEKIQAAKKAASFVAKEWRGKVFWVWEKRTWFLPSMRVLKERRGRQAVAILAVLTIAAVLVLARTVWAADPPTAKDPDVGSYIWTVLAYISEWVASLFGQLLLWAIDLLIQVSKYNSFLDANVVSVGWVLVRDVANMFFILIMLVIAFGTMLKIEAYSWKKLLPRLILTALLVNFSKTFIGLLIDFSQVIMLTFVNGYAAAAGGNFMELFQIEKLFQVSTNQAPNTGSYGPLTFSVAMGFALGAVMLGIALIVVLIFAALLVFRIITLWILIVLSPLAFLLGTFPKGQEYYGQWWKQLQGQIIVGPMVAFFLWLSLAALGGGDINSQVSYKANATGDMSAIGETAKIGTQTSAGEWDNIASFAISIAMLLMSLQMISQLGVAGAGLASGALSTIKSKATGLAKKLAVPVALGVATGGVGTGLMAWGGLGVGKWAGKKAIGSWEKGTGMVGMAKDVYSRAGSYIEKKGYEGRGIGRVYGWKYHLGEKSSAKVEKAKEEEEFAKTKAVGRAREEVERERKEPRIAHEQKAVLARVNQIQKDYGEMDFTELMAALHGSLEEIKRKPGDADANARMLAVLKLVASDGRVDDANADLAIVESLFGKEAIAEEKDKDGNVVKRSVDVTGETQRRLLLKQMFNLGPGGKITEGMLNDPIFQGNLSILEDIGRTGQKIGHYQFSKMRVFDEAKQRYTIRGLQQQPDGTYDYTDETDKAILAAQESDMGKKTYLGDSAPQSFFDHRVEYTYDKDGKQTGSRMKRVMKTDGGMDLFDKSGLSGLGYADVGRKSMQPRLKVDLLEGNLADKFQNIDKNGVLTTADDFLEKLAKFPGTMALAMMEAKSQGAKKIKYKNKNGEEVTSDISDISRDTADKKVNSLLGHKAVAERPLAQEVAEETKAVKQSEINSHIVEHTTDNTGATHPELQADLREALSISPTIDLGDLKDLQKIGPEIGKQIDKLVDAAGKFGAGMEKAAAVVGKTIRENVQTANPSEATQLNIKLEAILRELRKKLMVKGGDRDNLKQYMDTLIAEVEAAQKPPTT